VDATSISGLNEHLQMGLLGGRLSQMFSCCVPLFCLREDLSYVSIYVCFCSSGDAECLRSSTQLCIPDWLQCSSPVVFVSTTSTTYMESTAVRVK